MRALSNIVSPILATVPFVHHSMTNEASRCYPPLASVSLRKLRLEARLASSCIIALSLLGLDVEIVEDLVINGGTGSGGEVVETLRASWAGRRGAPRGFDNMLGILGMQHDPHRSIGGTAFVSLENCDDEKAVRLHCMYG